MQSHVGNHYLISSNRIDWDRGLLADALATALLGLVDANALSVVNYSMKEGYTVNCAGVFIKLLK